MNPMLQNISSVQFADIYFGQNEWALRGQGLELCQFNKLENRA